MTTPAERYAAFRQSQAESGPALTSFRGLYDFELDDFQLDACRALEAGDGVLVAAPTGSGKTVVGEFAVHLALAEGRKCFYTTPIKALSNQKYNDLVRRYGATKVGLLTGDNSVNGEAPIVVMTTEVLRNMLYAGSGTLAGLGFVVMDEVHYLADRFRGAVWEEVIIHLPESVRLVALSATVSNAEEFGEWMGEVRGDTSVIVDEHRPVPLWQHMLVGNRIYDLFVTGDGDRRPQINPNLLRIAKDEERQAYGRGRRGYSRPRRSGPPDRAAAIERLDTDALLPAITFIFSRAGCDAAVMQCLHDGIRLTTDAERHEIRQIVDERTAHLPDEDLAVLGYLEWRDALERGLASHHAGMLPAFKEVVEELFTRGLVKAVFATETLALGINMPARSVVIEKLDKWNGETHADLTPGEYTQLTGRAGRRGIDVEGHAVVQWQPGTDPLQVAGLASTRTYPLRSSFRPSYNMAVNLVGQVGRERARTLLESSFAQFQADRAVVGIAKQVRRAEEALEGYRQAMTCHLGDFEEYAAMRRALSDREAELSRQRGAARRTQALRSLEALKPGDIIRVPGGRRAGLAVVLDPGLNSRGEGPSPLVLTIGKQVKKLSPADFPVPVEPVEHLRIPKNFNARSPKERANLVSSVHAKIGDRDFGKPVRARDHAAEDEEIIRLRREIRRHPCHGCDEREDHARWAERYHKLLRETEGLRRRVEGRSHVIARTFDKVCGVLDQLGYLDGESVTAEGRRLAQLYTELDLLTAECLRAGLWNDLDPAELAACVSSLVFESRQADDARQPRIPAGGAQKTLADMVRLWGELESIESDHGLSFIREPDFGFAWAAFRWAKGHTLDSVLRDGAGGAELAAGDFVRWIKQLLDLLGQISNAAPGGSKVKQSAGKAMDALRRGVVAYSSLT
ncbi:DEAD/DEAH box helicase [Streptosporangium sp. NBC_01755]|uniref:DEAD/DEAH box helicase n=1 Tax=unclassified Streptosporangium TaxID=2632669 RepID=UPI002DDB375C|nr:MULTISPECIES: DEAD/DEAH box helicase [unclassified Streptosporangium]WSA29065.1 DEAD/DEAH box helicase [Streptosporangium sp. NBC_01810]WSC99488.1 DEAD/DEAH box helicase [Streptosporangium sp. NBC_01755]